MTALPQFAADVVCGVDFSESSGRAVAWAHMLAARLGQRLVVVAAIDPLLAEAATFQAGRAGFLEDARRDLEEFVAPIIGRPKDGSVTLEVAVGEPATALGDFAGGPSAIIAVGTHGLGRAERFFFGSTTLRLMRAGAWSVLAVPHARTGHGDLVPDDPPDVQRIVCGVDFSAASAAAAVAAHALGLALAVPVEIVHAVAIATLPTVWDRILAPRENEQVASALAQLDAVARDLGDPVPACTTRIGRPEEVLGAEAAKQPSLVVLGLGDASGHRPGTTAIRVISETRVPVLTVPLN